MTLLELLLMLSELAVRNQNDSMENLYIHMLKYGPAPGVLHKYEEPHGAGASKLQRRVFLDWQGETASAYEREEELAYLQERERARLRRPKREHLSPKGVGRENNWTQYFPLEQLLLKVVGFGVFSTSRSSFTRISKVLLLETKTGIQNSERGCWM